jgi:bifunctional UDP-N-acetylglucosamine pyrophosphorylase/glucosamine-1-phosphate N-acetyltransferase
MKFRCIVLAAGKGTRMKQDIPKTLTPVGGKPILQHLHESIIASDVGGAPVVVISPDQPKLCDAFAGECMYAYQEEQLGTAHAASMAGEQVDDVDSVIVLYGDHPFVSADSIKGLAKLHEESAGVLTMLTTTVPSFDDWYKGYNHWGRVLRDADGHIIGVREYKDAMESEREIMELNPSLFCFDRKWFWENIGQVKNTNASGEYYLTDMVELAVVQGHKIVSMSIPPEEAIGINTQEERAVAEKLLAERHGETA